MSIPFASLGSLNRRQRVLKRIEDRIHRLTVKGQPDTRWQKFVNCITEYGYAVSAIRRVLGMSTPLHTVDRAILEELIFPFYTNNSEFTKILFVGCAVFTSHYQRQFFAGKDFWTIEPDARQAKYGASNHIVGPLEEASKHFEPSKFDVMFCNGGFGWGLEPPAQGEAAFIQCHNALRSGGHLVFGWNDVPQRTPFSLESIQSRKAFEQLPFPPLRTWRYLTNTRHRHVFDFYRK